MPTTEIKMGHAIAIIPELPSRRCRRIADMPTTEINIFSVHRILWSLTGFLCSYRVFSLPKEPVVFTQVKERQQEKIDYIIRAL
jgi:hypothetical protein